MNIPMWGQYVFLSCGIVIAVMLAVFFLAVAALGLYTFVKTVCEDMRLDRQGRKWEEDRQRAVERVKYEEQPGAFRKGGTA
jgi:predicted RND superfamily exporter protein